MRFSDYHVSVPVNSATREVPPQGIYGTWADAGGAATLRANAPQTHPLSTQRTKTPRSYSGGYCCAPRRAVENARLTIRTGAGAAATRHRLGIPRDLRE